MDCPTKPFHDRPKPLRGCPGTSRSGFLFGLAGLAAIWLMTGTASASDGATEALELRYHAEMAIAEEADQGEIELAGVMRELLPNLLVEHLVTRDATITLDTVDAAFVDGDDGFHFESCGRNGGVAACFLVGLNCHCVASGSLLLKRSEISVH